MTANSVDPDQTPRPAASDQGLHCLPGPICPNTWDKYGTGMYITRNCPDGIVAIDTTQGGTFSLQNNIFLP